MVDSVKDSIPPAGQGEHGANYTETRAQPTGQDYTLQGLATYVDGKMKRYSLLFTVNGGAFAIAKLLGESEVVGGLTLEAVAIGAIIFTVLMWFDIFAFGEMMRSDFLKGNIVFKLQGKLILTVLSLLLIIGWLLAAFPETPFYVVALPVLVILSMQVLYWRRPSWANRLVVWAASRLGVSAGRTGG